VRTHEDRQTFLFRSVLCVSRLIKNVIQRIVSFLQSQIRLLRFFVNGVNDMFGLDIVNICGNPNINIDFRYGVGGGQQMLIVSGNFLTPFHDAWMK